MRAAGNRQADIRVASERNGVRGILSADVHLQLEVDQFLAILGSTAGNLVNAGSLAGLDSEEFGASAFGGHFGFDSFCNGFDGKVQAIGDHGNRFR